MKHIAFILPIFTCGCAGAAVPPSDATGGSPSRSSLTHGIYFGTETCEQEVRINGQEASQTIEGEFTLVISESGIPVRNGEEEYVGRTDRIVMGGSEFTATVIEVSAFSNGVRVIDSGNLTTNDGELLYRDEVTYRSLNSREIEVSSELIFVATVNSETASISTDCRGIYSQ